MVRGLPLTGDVFASDPDLGLLGAGGEETLLPSNQFSQFYKLAHHQDLVLASQIFETGILINPYNLNT